MLLLFTSSFLCYKNLKKINSQDLMLHLLLRRIPVDRLSSSNTFTKSALIYRYSYLPLVTAAYNIQTKMSSTSTPSCLVTFVTCPSMEVARDLSR